MARFQVRFHSPMQAAADHKAAILGHLGLKSPVLDYTVLNKSIRSSSAEHRYIQMKTSLPHITLLSVGLQHSSRLAQRWALSVRHVSSLLAEVAAALADATRVGGGAAVQGSVKECNSFSACCARCGRQAAQVAGKPHLPSHRSHRLDRSFWPSKLVGPPALAVLVLRRASMVGRRRWHWVGMFGGEAGGLLTLHPAGAAPRSGFPCPPSPSSTPHPHQVLCKGSRQQGRQVVGRLGVLPPGASARGSTSAARLRCAS